VGSYFEDYNYDARNHKIIASDMEKYHKRIYQQFIDDDGFIRTDIMREIFVQMGLADRDKWLIFCSHAPVAKALFNTMIKLTNTVFFIDGDLAESVVESEKQGFIKTEGKAYLIGTATLATGVDGIDKVCQTLLILDDIRGDGSLRRQLIGRILPRGEDDGISRLVITATF